jgi:hypothetical protein
LTGGSFEESQSVYCEADVSLEDHFPP